MSAAGSVTQAEPTPGIDNDEPPPSHAPIILLDHTVTNEAPEHSDPAKGVTNKDNVTPETSARPSVERELSRRWTRTNLQNARIQRKYAKYQEDQITEHPPDPSTPAGPQGRRDRAKTLVKDFRRNKRIRQKQEEDSIIEILHENQRGFFTFGTPHFSSRSLLNFDPKPWTNAAQRGSPVNITNAQVPDPSWEWAWKSWYVDMSRDVDEDGWEYSLLFVGTSWHGTHPWFHSFVRRRRWLRKRVRKGAHHGGGEKASTKHLSEAHMLTPEYFTIHPSRSRSLTDRPGSVASSESVHEAEDDEKEKEEVADIATLLLLLRRATIDREKIVLVRSFLHNASDELYYLTEEMPHIMSLLMFQNSRRDLLRVLLDELRDASEHRNQHEDDGKEEGEREKKRIDFLLKATDAADREVKNLQYWSDIRGMVRDGKTAAAVDGAEWDADRWEGVDASGPGVRQDDGVKEDGKTAEEIEEEARLHFDSDGANDTDEQESEALAEVAKAADGQKREEELPRIGPGNDVHRLAEEEPVSLEEYDRAKDTVL